MRLGVGWSIYGARAANLGARSARGVGDEQGAGQFSCGQFACHIEHGCRGVGFGLRGFAAGRRTSIDDSARSIAAAGIGVAVCRRLRDVAA